MGTRARRITIEVGGEDVGAGKTLRGTGDDLDKLGTKLRGVGDDAKKGFGGVEDEADKLSSKLKAAGDKAGDTLASSMKSAGSDASSALSSGFDVEGIADMLTDKIGSLSSHGGKIGMAFGAVGLAAGGAFALGLFNGMDIEAANDKLTAQLGLTEQQSEAFGKAAGHLYSQAYGESIEDVNVALAAVHSSLGDALGPGEDALERIGAKAMDVAGIFEVDVTEAAGLAGFAVNQGLAKDADHAFDLIVASMQRMPAGMRQELFPTIEEYGDDLHALGFTGEQAFGLLAAASKGGSFQIDKTADALKELQIRATDMSTSTVDAFKTIGLDAQEMGERFLAGGDSAMSALDDMAAGLLAIEDPVKRSNTAIALFGTPLEDMSVTQIPDFLEGLLAMNNSLGDVGGAAAKAGDDFNDNAKTKIEAFRREALMKLTDFVANSVLPKLQAFGDWAKEHPAAFKILAGVIGGVLVTALVAYTAASIAATVATLGWSWPILAVGAAIAALAIIVATNFGTIKQWAENVFNWLKTNWPYLAAIITAPFGGPIVLAIVKNWDKMKAAASGAKDWIVARAHDIGGAITAIPDKIKGALGGLGDAIKAPFVSAFRAIKTAWNSTIGGFEFKVSVPNIPGLPHRGEKFGFRIPEMHQGGIFHAPFGGGGEGLALLRDGEYVFTPEQMADTGAGGDTYYVTENHYHIAGSVWSERELMAVINRNQTKGVTLKERRR